MNIFYKKNTAVLIGLLFVALFFVGAGSSSSGENYAERCYVIINTEGTQAYEAYRLNDSYYMPLQKVKKIFGGRVLSGSIIRINGYNVLCEFNDKGDVNLSKLMADENISKHFLSYAFDDGNFVIGKLSLNQIERAKQFIVVSYTKNIGGESIIEDYVLIKIYVDYRGDMSLTVKNEPAKDAVEKGITRLSGLYKNVKYYDEKGRTTRLGLTVKWKSRSDFVMQKYINSYIDFYSQNERAHVSKIGGTDMYLYTEDTDFYHVVTHEFVHLLGLPDGYYEAGKQSRAPRNLADNNDMMVSVCSGMKISNLHIHMILQYLNGNFAFRANGEPNIVWDVLKYKIYTPTDSDTEYDKPYNPNNPKDNVLKHRNTGKGRADDDDYTNSNLWYRTLNTD